MKIRTLLPKFLISLAALAAGLQVRATPIASSTSLYATFTAGAGAWQFDYGVSENTPAGTAPWDVTVLTIAGFTNSVWGSTYTLNAGNTPTFGAFMTMLTDGEVDWIGRRILQANGSGGSGYSPEPNAIFSAASGPFGVDLIGYDITEITITFAEDHTFDFLTPQVQGKYTVSFFGTVAAASVPEAGSSLGLLAGALGLLVVTRRLPTRT
jgi:hypothetical protein